MTINLRAQISDYANRVLGVIKEKYGLKDKSEAIDKFTEMFGEEFVESEVKEDIVKDMIKECEGWERKHKFKRKMSIKELDKLCGM
ncbi:DUF2683 family protein [Candidatus Woesearchaeota archaeon]|nr:DUF2683 family protein [Candidatus Woesearchaeota archaeon]